MKALECDRAFLSTIRRARRMAIHAEKSTSTLEGKTATELEKELAHDYSNGITRDESRNNCEILPDGQHCSFIQDNPLISLQGEPWLSPCLRLHEHKTQAESESTGFHQESQRAFSRTIRRARRIARSGNRRAHEVIDVLPANVNSRFPETSDFTLKSMSYFVEASNSSRTGIEASGYGKFLSPFVPTTRIGVIAPFDFGSPRGMQDQQDRPPGHLDNYDMSLGPPVHSHHLDLTTASSSLAPPGAAMVDDPLPAHPVSADPNPRDIARALEATGKAAAPTRGGGALSNAIGSNQGQDGRIGAGAGAGGGGGAGGERGGAGPGRGGGPSTAAAETSTGPPVPNSAFHVPLPRAGRRPPPPPSLAGLRRARPASPDACPAASGADPVLPPPWARPCPPRIPPPPPHAEPPLPPPPPAGRFGHLACAQAPPPPAWPIPPPCGAGDAWAQAHYGLLLLLSPLPPQGRPPRGFPPGPPPPGPWGPAAHLWPAAAAAQPAAPLSWPV